MKKAERNVDLVLHAFHYGLSPVHAVQCIKERMSWIELNKPKNEQGLRFALLRKIKSSELPTSLKVMWDDEDVNLYSFRTALNDYKGWDAWHKKHMSIFFKGTNVLKVL